MIIRIIIDSFSNHFRFTRDGRFIHLNFGTLDKNTIYSHNITDIYLQNITHNQFTGIQIHQLCFTQDVKEFFFTLGIQFLKLFLLHITVAGLNAHNYYYCKQNCTALHPASGKAIFYYASYHRNYGSYYKNAHHLIFETFHY